MQFIEGETAEYLSFTLETGNQQFGYETEDKLLTPEQWHDLRSRTIEAIQDTNGGEYFPMAVRMFTLHEQGRISDTTIVSLVRDALGEVI